MIRSASSALRSNQARQPTARRWFGGAYDFMAAGSRGEFRTGDSAEVRAGCQLIGVNAGDYLMTADRHPLPVRAPAGWI